MPHKVVYCTIRVCGNNDLFLAFNQGLNKVGSHVSFTCTWRTLNHIKTIVVISKMNALILYFIQIFIFLTFSIGINLVSSCEHTMKFRILGTFNFIDMVFHTPVGGVINGKIDTITILSR